jgi:hypothetical protein
MIVERGLTLAYVDDAKKGRTKSEPIAGLRVGAESEMAPLGLA